MQILYWVGSIVLGFAAGTLVNILADFLPSYFDLNRGDEKARPLVCSRCKKPVKINVYWGLKACASCGRFPAIRNWVVMLSYPLLFVIFFAVLSGRYAFWELALLAVYLGLVAVIDLEHKVILEAVSLAGLIIALPIGWLHHGLVNTLLGGIAGYGIMLVLYHLGVLFTKWVSRHREQPVDEVALGAGDTKLSGVLGLLLGWPGITLGLLFAILMGGLVSLFILVFSFLKHKYESFTAIPYAPFLVLGAMILLVWPGN